MPILNAPGDSIRRDLAGLSAVVMEIVQCHVRWVWYSVDSMVLMENGIMNNSTMDSGMMGSEKMDNGMMER
jgi:hypothetical protein